MKNRKAAGVLGILLLILCLSGCGGTGQQEEALSEEAETVEFEEAEEEEEKEEEIEEPEEEAPVYMEDTNVYGNTIGNSYNDGTFVYDEYNDCLYFYDIYEGGVVKTDAETGHTVILTDIPLIMLNLYDEKLYGINVDEEGNHLNVQRYDLQTGSLDVVLDKPVQYLLVVNGELYFTDQEENKLRRMSADGGEEEILVDEPVYFPVVYKDMIVFQLDSDKESLYSMPIDGGEPEKLNDMRSYYPIVYRDKIYYQTIDDDEKPALRCMNLDGSEETVILEERPINCNLYDDKYYFITEDTVNKVSYIDLTDEKMEVQELNLGDPIKKALKDTYGVQECRILRFTPIQFGGNYILIMCEMNVDGVDYLDEYLYRTDTEELFIIPEYCIDEEIAINLEDLNNLLSQAAAESAGAQGNEQASQQSEKDAQARAVAQSIADSISAGSDLERVRAAASIVAGYCANATYTSSDPDYRTAYGVFCKGVYTCAGATRAMGLVLECMGYSWTHANPNQWTHQWCELTMDGQPGWADGMGGIADYGACPFASGGSYTAPDGTTYFTP